jgi:hypothetical protein
MTRRKTVFGVRTRILKWNAKRRNTAALPQRLKRALTLAELQQEHLSRTEVYLYCDYYFDHFLPEEFREHRRFFSTAGRGFGEDAFHAMWFLLFQQFRPAHALEIGVYRGQTITLWKLLARHFGFECEVSCVSPFNSAGDAVSAYKNSLDYHADVMSNHQQFQLPVPNVHKGFSNSPEAISFIRSRPWDLVYIDGNHDYAVARHDWGVCSNALAPRGTVVLDDSALETDFSPPAFSTAGHPGPSKVAAEINSSQFEEILAVGHNRVFQRRN